MNAPIQPHNLRPASVWSSGGQHYEEISRQISSALEHCVRRVDPRPGERILDVATGTGWTSRLLASRGAVVTGVDFADQLVAAAARVGQARGLDVTYEVGDAEKLRFEDGQFDAVVSTFGVMFATRPEDVARELGRVCRRGGRLALTTWAPDGNVFGMFKVMRAYMPTPPAGSPPSPFEWGKKERLTELLGKDFELTFEEGDAVYYDSSGEAAWTAFVTGYGPTLKLAESLEPDRRESLRKDFIAFHEQFAAPLGIAVPRKYVLTVGRRR